MKNIVDPIKNIDQLGVTIQREVEKLIAQIKDKYKDEVNKIIGSVAETVECYKNEADRLQINIKDCYQSTQNVITSIPNEFLKNITKCGTDEIDNGMALVKSATDLFDFVKKDLDGIPDRITACTKEGWWTATTCITGVIADIGGMAISIPSKIVPQLNGFIDKITSFVTGIPIRLQVCGASVVANVGMAAKDLAGDFFNCIKDKFPNPNICLPA